MEAHTKGATFAVSAAFFVMGLTPWLLVNGIFSELPILALTLPEGYSIASFLVVFIQFGNLVAFTFALTQSFPKTHVSPAKAVALIYITATALAVLLCFFWSNAVVLPTGGPSRSVALLALSFFCGVVGATSMVSIFPFAAVYGGAMIGALSAGSGANGLVPSLLALAQGAQDASPRFSVQAFFLILGGVIAISFLCFVLIARHRIPRSFIIPFESHSDGSQKGLLTNEVHHDVEVHHDQPAPVGFFQSMRPLALHLIHECYISLLQYILVGLMPFAFQGYGDAGRAYLFWNTFCPIVLGALSRLMTIKFRFVFLIPQAIIQSAFAAFLMSQCFMQHDASSTAWPVVTIVCNSLYAIFYGYSDTINFQSVHPNLPPELLERGSRMMGVVNQLGAMSGSFIGFGLVQGILQKH